jgi:hypothetical protein
MVELELALQELQHDAALPHTYLPSQLLVSPITMNLNRKA